MNLNNINPDYHQKVLLDQFRLYKGVRPIYTDGELNFPYAKYSVNSWHQWAAGNFQTADLKPAINSTLYVSFFDKASKAAYSFNWTTYLKWDSLSSPLQTKMGLVWMDGDKDGAYQSFGTSFAASPSNRMLQQGGVKGWGIDFSTTTISSAPQTIGFPATGTVNVFNTSTIIRGTVNESFGWILNNTIDGIYIFYIKKVLTQPSQSHTWIFLT
jgi:hypothetical protein